MTPEALLEKCREVAYKAVAEWLKDNGDKRSVEEVTSEAFAREFAPLVEALEGMLPRLAHTVECTEINRTEDWVARGSLNFDNCKCEISEARAALARLSKGGG